MRQDVAQAGVRQAYTRAVGDGVLVVLMFGLGWLVLRSQDRFVRPGMRGYVLMSVSGLLVSPAAKSLGAITLIGKPYSPRLSNRH